MIGAAAGPMAGLTAVTPGIAQEPPSVVAITGVTVLPMTTGAPSLPNRTVLIESEVIRAIGAVDSVEVPDDALRIDGTGKYLIPGLADMHVHLEYFDDPAILGLFVANGVTTVRNMDGRPYLLQWRERVEAGELLGPRIVTAGPLLDGDPPILPDNTVVNDPEEATRIVTAQDSAGYDFIKVYSNLSAAAYEAVVERAGALGLPVAGHLSRTLDVFDVMERGQVTIEHLGEYADVVESADSPYADGYHWSKRFLGVPMDTSAAEAVARRQAASDTWTVPTMVQSEREIARADAVQRWLGAPEMVYLPPDTERIWTGRLERTRQRMDAEDWALVDRGRQNRVQLLGILSNAGVGLLVGTDTPNPFVVPGFSVRAELAWFAAAGLSPGRALAAATREPARFLGESDRWGTVEVGKRADLVLLDADPLEDLAHTGRIAGVVLRGDWLSRDALDRILEMLSTSGAP